MDPSNPDVSKLEFHGSKKIFAIVMRKDPNRGPKNWQKYILQQKNVVAGKNLPYGIDIYINVGVKISIRTSGMQSHALIYFRYLV